MRSGRGFRVARSVRQALAGRARAEAPSLAQLVQGLAQLVQGLAQLVQGLAQRTLALREPLVPRIAEGVAARPPRQARTLLRQRQSPRTKNRRFRYQWTSSSRTCCRF
jgi:hypothetical protein